MYEDRATFYTALSAFTEDGPNARFLEDMIFNDDGTIRVHEDICGHARGATIGAA